MAKRRKTSVVSPPPTETVVISHAQDPHADIFILLWMFVKATLLAFVFVTVTFLLILSGFAYAYLHTVSAHAGVGIRQLLSTVQRGWNTTVTLKNGRENILLLGVDTLGNRSSTNINTDTIMVVSFDTRRGSITTFPIPRDLFLAKEKVKINGIYDVALHAGNPHPELQVKTAVEDVTGVSIHRVVLLEMGELGKLIDAMGGINVNIERSFTDEMFPREDVDVTQEHDPAKLYKTVSFQAGTQRMDGQQALEFIRSRHSKDPWEGSDDARAKRQQRMIEGLLDRVDDRDIPHNPGYVGDLLRLYSQDFAKYIPLEEVIAMGKTLMKLKRLPTFDSRHFAIQDFEKDPVLYHPETFYTKQWVYLPVDPTGKKMRDVVAAWLP